MKWHVREPYDLDEHMTQWVDRGLVEPEQASRIRQFERTAPVVSRRLSLVAEFIIYVGIVLVVASGAVFVNRLWHDIGLAGRAGVGLVVGVVGLLGGGVLSRLGEPGTIRLSGFLRLCGTGGVAMTTAVVADRIGHQHAATTVLWTGLLVAALSIALWRNGDRPLQFLSSVAGVVMVVVATVNAYDWRFSTVSTGLALWTAGLALGVLSDFGLQPRLPALWLGQFAALMGALAVVSENHALGLTLGFVVALLGVAYGVTRQENVALGLGIVSFFAMAVRLLALYLHGPVATLISFIIGVTLVVLAMWRTTHHRSHPSAF